MIKNIMTFIVLYSVHAANTIADDIEIYQNGDYGIRPNVMFLLDTSGSMEETVEFSKGPYNPDTIYPGPFHTDRYYFKQTTLLASLIDELFDWDAEFLRKSMIDNHFPAEAFKCQSLETNLIRYGYVASQFLQWDPNQAFKTGWKQWGNFHETANRKGVWKQIKQTSDSDISRYVDCKLDINNNHGLTTNDNLYMSHYENGRAYSTNINNAVGNNSQYDNFLGGLIKNNNAYSGGNDRRYWKWGLIKEPQTTKTIFTGNYLNYDFYTGKDEITEASRMYVMGAAIAEAVGTNPGLNVGLARFDGRFSSIFTGSSSGGMISIPMSKSEEAAKIFENTIKSWDPYGWTPMSEAYYEVSRYMRGESPVFGNHTMGRKLTGNVFQDIPVPMPSVNESKVDNNAGNNYQSPIEESCQSNHIVIFTDGQPTQDISANDAIKDLTKDLPMPDDLKGDCANDGPLQLNGSFSLGSYKRGHGQCSDNLAYYLANTDQVEESKIEGTQAIITHTIGGFITTDESANADPILKSMAKYGEGSYSSIKTLDEMRAAFASILGGVLQNPASFTAPVVSVNAFNSLELSDELYYSVFEPRSNLQWAGNLKRYKLDVIENSSGEYSTSIVDSRGDDAIDPETTYFKSTAKSFWTLDDPDGEVVTSGGMANRLTHSRNIFTSQSSNNNLVSLDTVNKTQLNIADKVTKDPEYMKNLIAWANGFDVDKPESDGTFTSQRKSMEDPLHSEPTIIKYSSSIAANGDKLADKTLFIGTNSGYVHAFDVNENSPKEHFSFIPKELLHNLDKYYSGGNLYEHKAYGIDGPLTHWHHDTNGNGQLDDGEQVYLYITMRRGGQSLYALNVSDRTSPYIQWEKHGDYPIDFPNRPDVSAGYENLGQTWARMEPATVNWNNEQRVVLFTAGGYDPAEDGTDSHGPTTRLVHTQGTTIYMIDAISGGVLWDAKLDATMPSGIEMTSSFAANVAPLDTSGDGLANMLYASDVGGRIWRFDIKSPSIDPTLADDFITDKKNFAQGSAILDVNSGTGTDNRRFFNEVDVIYQKSKESFEDSVLLSIGSGMRPHPLSDVVTNYHFIAKDTLTAPIKIEDYHTITFDDLTEYGTDNDYGWYIPLTYPGEKVLSRSNTISDYILFSTFAPNEVSTTVVNCNADPGRTMLYIVNKGSIKKQALEQGGIPPSPTIIEPPTVPEMDEDGKQKKKTGRRKRNIIVGTEIIMDTNSNKAQELDNEDPTSKNYWLEVANPDKLYETNASK